MPLFSWDLYISGVGGVEDRQYIRKIFNIYYVMPTHNGASHCPDLGLALSSCKSGMTSWDAQLLYYLEVSTTLYIILWLSG